MKTAVIILSILVAGFILVKWFLASVSPLNGEYEEHGGSIDGPNDSNEQQSN